MLGQPPATSALVVRFRGRVLGSSSIFLLCLDNGLLCLDTGLLCLDTGLLCLDTGLLCLDAGLLASLFSSFNAQSTSTATRHAAAVSISPTRIFRPTTDLSIRGNCALARFSEFTQAPVQPGMPLAETEANRPRMQRPDGGVFHLAGVRSEDTGMVELGADRDPGKR